MFVADYQTQKANIFQKGDTSTPELISHDISLERRDTLAEEIRAFVKCVRDGNRPLVSGIEGRRALLLAQIITENIEKGKSGFTSMP